MEVTSSCATKDKCKDTLGFTKKYMLQDNIECGNIVIFTQIQKKNINLKFFWMFVCSVGNLIK